MRRLIEIALPLMVLACTLLVQGRVSEQSQSAPAGWAVEEYRVAPVRVHLIRAREIAAANTRLTREDVERIFRKVNGIWHAAGVHFWVESVVEEPPAEAGAARISSDAAALPGDSLLALRPAGTRPERMFHVYYVGAMAVNGLYVGRDAIFVQEVSRLMPVPGGIDEPLPRVTAHELGHALSLPHRQDRVNLMASGTTGTGLNDQEVHAVRRSAEGKDWIEPAGPFLNAADALWARGKRSEADSRFRAVLQIPGNSTLKDRARARIGAVANTAR